MKAPRSLASTTAPHLIILSTSLIHEGLLKRCCRIMRESWHSVQAVRTFSCAEAAGRSGDCPLNGDAAASNASAIARAICLSEHGLNELNDMNLHLIDGVVKISTRIPGRVLRLAASLIIGGA